MFRLIKGITNVCSAFNWGSIVIWKNFIVRNPLSQMAGYLVAHHALASNDPTHCHFVTDSFFRTRNHPLLRTTGIKSLHVKEVGIRSRFLSDSGH